MIKDLAGTFCCSWNSNLNSPISANYSWVSSSTEFTTLKREISSQWHKKLAIPCWKRGLSKASKGTFKLKLISNTRSIFSSKDSSLSACFSWDIQQPSRKLFVTPTTSMLWVNLGALPLRPCRCGFREVFERLCPATNSSTKWNIFRKSAFSLQCEASRWENWDQFKLFSSVRLASGNVSLNKSSRPWLKGLSQTNSRIWRRHSSTTNKGSWLTLIGPSREKHMWWRHRAR